MLTRLKALPFISGSYYKAPPFLGLDLGFKEIRLLQLEKKGERYQLAKRIVAPLRRETVWEEQLQLLVSEAGLAGSSVALALPASALLKKQIELPERLSEAELIQAVEQRLCQYFPGHSEKELYYDFVLKTTREDKQQLVVFATRKETIQRLVDCIQKAGLQAKILDVDTFALARAAALFFYPREAFKPGAVALFDLRWPFCSLIVFQGEELIFHQQWRAPGTNPEASYELTQFMEELCQIWQLFKAAQPKLKLNVGGVAGELAELALIAEQIQARFSLATQVINPFQTLSSASPPDLQTNTVSDSRFLLCCGLALRGFRPC